MRLVLDTNVVLDWLVFDDPAVRLLAQRIDSKRAMALANEQTIGELRRVLGYPILKLSEPKAQQLFDRFLSVAHSLAMPPQFARDNLMLPNGFPRCRDRDDDTFLALAYHAKADALVTKDKALLKLRKRALKFGVRIATVSELNAMLKAFDP